MKRLKKVLSLVTLPLFVLSFGGCLSGTTHTQSKGLSVKEKTTGFSKSTTQKRQALIVGVGDYAEDAQDLHGIERDVSKMKKLFESWGFEITVLYDKDSMQIVDYLNKYGNSLNSNDTFAFYYSGHGSHQADTNGDESDGQDETLVLSDGKENVHLVDDILYAKFNAIKAKKMIFFDSCHSGTVFRELNKKSQKKTISPKLVGKSLSKGISVDKKSAKIDRDANFVVFSSSQDNEESLATPTGSLFTNSLYEIFLDQNSQEKSLGEIGDLLRLKVSNYAKETQDTPHHPTISFSKSYSNSNRLKDVIQTKSTTPPPTQSAVSVANVEEKTLQDTLDNLIDNKKMKSMSLDYQKSSYKSGESVEFSLDTAGEKGYLTIFYVDSNEITLLYPNPFVESRELQGKYTFPKDLANGKFELEAYKNCAGCQEEKTTIYTLLSTKPILDISAIRSSDGLMSFTKSSRKSKVLSRAVKLKATSSASRRFEPQLSKYEFVVR